MSLYACLTAAWSAAAIASILAFQLWLEARTARQRHDRLMRWIRGHLLLIRTTCATSSEEAISVVNSLEVGLPLLTRVDIDGLARRLYQLRAARDQGLLRAAGEIAKHPGKAGGA